MAVTAGVVEVLFNANLSGFNNGLRRVQERLQALGRNLSAVGGQLTTGFTIPFGIAAGVSAKFASDFEASMTKINTLVGVNMSQVQEWRKEILALAPAVGKGPRELADALFFITSAGQRGADAMAILEKSAKAAAIGLGETKTVADAVTSAMNAYESSGLTAAQATDILVASVREGKVEANELAPAIGRVLGFANEMGVSFAEVGGFIASFTRVGVNAREAVTGLRGILNALVGDAPQQIEAVEQLGMTMEDLRSMVDRRGLAQTLVDLIDRFGDNNTALRDLIPRVRAYAAALSTARSQGKQFIDISGRIKNSLGITEEGFTTIERTIRQKAAKLLARLEVMAVKIGEALVPAMEDLIDILEPVAQGIAEMASRFAELSTTTQKVLGGIFAFTVAMGPLLFILGQVVTAISSLVAVGVGLGAIFSGGGLIVLGITALIAALGTYVFQTGQAALETQEFTRKLKELRDLPKFGEVGESIEDLKKRVRSARLLVDSLSKMQSEAEERAEGVSLEGGGASGRLGLGITEKTKEETKARADLANITSQLSLAEAQLTKLRAKLNIARRQKIEKEKAEDREAAAKAAREDAEAVQELLDKLREEHEELTTTRRERILNNLELHNATKAHREEAKTLLDKIKLIKMERQARESQKQVMQDIDRFLSQRRQFLVRTGRRTLQEEIDLIDKKLETRKLGVQEELDLEEKKFNLMSQMQRDRIQEARRLSEQSIGRAINILRNLEAEARTAGFPALAEQARAAITDIRTSAEQEAERTGQRLQRIGVSAGTSLVQGIITGAQDASELLKRAMLNFIVRVIEFQIFSGLGIASPSKKGMAWGRSIGEGMALGIKSSKGLVASASRGLVSAASMGGLRASGSLTSPTAGAVPTSGGSPGELLKIIRESTRGDVVLAAREPELVRLIGQAVENYIERGGTIR